MQFSSFHKSIEKLLATLFGIGYIPLAPGTAGTLAATVVYLLIPEMFFINLFPGFLILGIISLTAVGITGSAESKMDRDDKRIVLDEFAGFFFAVFFLPKKLVLLLSAFILFRVFDIFKPEPVNILQKLKGGWGIMADDIMAGIYTNICLQIVIRVFPELIKT